MRRKKRTVKKRRFGRKIVLALTVIFLPFVIMLLMMVMLISGSQGSSETSTNSSAVEGEYAEHWSTGDPYTHNLFVKRYGIKAEQLDGYLDSTGIKYNKLRINGFKLLNWERASGVDVRAIVAMAQWESSFGTAGVATMPGANMFGYGAFDNNPENGANFSDEVAVIGLAKQTLKANKNETFKVQDDKAQKHANGTLNVATDGGVYFTDTSGSGKRRADTMAKIDKWIDDHGGTPKAPSSSGGGGVSKNIANGNYAHIFNVPYTVVQPYGKTPWSQGGGAWMYPMGRHSGIDLQGVGYETRDVPVFSATGGKVWYVGADPMGGYYIVIEPEFGGYVYYGHMKSSQVSTGQLIKKGQRIGVMGTGGGVYHVHFEYNKRNDTFGSANSADVDPSFLIQKNGTVTQNQLITP